MKRTGKELEEAIANRKIALEMARNAASRGDGVCGGLFALESAAHAAGLGFLATTAQDYDDDDEDIDVRPY